MVDNLIEYMNTFANYGTLACLIWLIWELRSIRRRDEQSEIAMRLLEAVQTLGKHYSIEEKLKQTLEEKGP